jgi:hypothetical protein
MIGRLTHTFKEEYVSQDKVRSTAGELDLHVEKIKEEAKTSMEAEARRIRLRTQNLIDREHKMLRESHRQCGEALATVQSRIKDACNAYGDATKKHSTSSSRS